MKLRRIKLSEDLVIYMESRIKMFNEELIHFIQTLEIPPHLKESMLYSIKAGGKRVRPLLVMASYEAYRKDVKKTIHTSAALEMIHTYSLIHDDLPAMDDDDYRRGKLTNHKVFDEATAILAGDSLLTYAFEIIANDPLLTDKEKVYTIQKLSVASGPQGMIAGQTLDIEAEEKEITLDELNQIHKNKTGALIQFAVHIGAYFAGASEEQLSYLDKYSYYIGLLFQVQDDILDITGDEERLGKPVGSDEINAKNTYPSLLGLEGAKKYRDYYAKEAKNALDKANARQSFLYDLIKYVAHRDH